MVLTLELIGLNILNRWLYRNISISILPGTLLYVKGANGAGKTSLLRMIAAIMNPSTGNVLINNIAVNILDKPYVLYVSHKLALRPYLTVYENLLRDTIYYDSSQCIEAALRYFELTNLRNLNCNKLSAGKQKRLALSRLLACNSQIWLLDEIMTNLDQRGKILVKNCIVSHLTNNGIAVVCDHSFNENYNELANFTLTVDLSEYAQ